MDLGKYNKYYIYSLEIHKYIYIIFRVFWGSECIYGIILLIVCLQMLPRKVAREPAVHRIIYW